MSSVDPARLVWQKSSRSGGANGGGGNCVEIAALPDGQLGVRDSKDPDGEMLLFDRSALAVWIAAIKVHQLGR